MNRFVPACAALALAINLQTSPCVAEIIELEGTIKAVDKAARTITIERKTPKGTKTLELEVAQTVRFSGRMTEGADIAFSYDPDLELVTAISLTSFPPMPLSELVDRFSVFERPPSNVKPEARQGIGVDQGFVLGYMTAVSELSGVKLHGTFSEQRDALKQYLAEHPEDASLPAHVVMVKVLKASDTEK